MAVYISLLSCTASVSQSFAPGTGRYWKRNPPAPPATVARPRVNLAEVRGAVQDAERAQKAADQAVAQVAQRKTEYDVALHSLEEAKNEAASLESDVRMKADALAAAQQALQQSQALFNTLERRMTSLSQTQKKNLFEAQSTQLKAQLAEQGQRLSGALTAVESAKSDLASAEAKRRTKDNEVTAAEQRTTEAQVAVRQSEAAAKQAESESKDAQSRAAKLQAEAAASAYTISASRGGIGYTDLINITIPKGGMPSFHIIVKGKSSSDSVSDFKTIDNCQKRNGEEQTCQMVVAFRPSGTDDENVEIDLSNATVSDGSSKTIQVSGKVPTEIDTVPAPYQGFLPLNHLPATPAAKFKLGEKLEGMQSSLENAFGTMLDVSNAFWSQEGSLSYLNQTQFFYNNDAGSSTLKADVASMVFPGGTQLALATNISVGTDNSTPAKASGTAAIRTSPSTLPNATSTTPPSLSSSQAAQAAVNLVDGGNLLLRASWPFFWYAPKYQNFSAYNLVVGREGLDIPNFNGANTVASDPQNHFNLSNESYVQFDALPGQKGGDSQGSIFLDAKYGFDYVSTSFAKQAGFTKNWNKGFLAQISGGLVFSGKLDIIATRSFGPSQTWIDSTTNAVTTQNNFRSWSVGVKYATNQSK